MILFTGYDEPNAEKKKLCRFMQESSINVSGVEGAVDAHKGIVETDRFITVDGDNCIRAISLIDFDENLDLTDKVISWTAKI